MTSRLAKSAAKSDLNSVRPQAGAGRFMVTLCTLDAPVSIRQPQSPRLQPFTFFVGRAYQADGTERFFLNMGYFNTLADAERWAEATRRQFPSAFATIAAGTPSPPVGVETSSASGAGPDAAAPGTDDPAAGGSLTDTQILKILETRGDARAPDDATRRDAAAGLGEIELLRPEDTVTRQALREAVVGDAPVWFAVQLHWSSEPIDLSRVRSLPVFRAHTLYATGISRHGRSRHFLRLGFFADPISAKQVAVQVRTAFDAAAVVPVVEPEITRAREASATEAIPYLGDSRLERHSDSALAGGSPPPPAQAGAALRRGRANAVTGTAAADAGQDMWGEPDFLSESGVRHLRVERQEELSGRWKIIRLREDAPNEAQLQA
jgi:hypothetical protein